MAVLGLLSPGGIVSLTPRFEDSLSTRLTQTVLEVSLAPNLAPLTILTYAVGLT